MERMGSMSEPIRILNVVGRMDRGGIETLVMNVYRHIDRSKVQFDFLAHYGKENADYNAEIRGLGGRIYEMPVIKTEKKTYYWKLFEYQSALKKFFKNHPEYHIVHGHMTNTAAIYMPIAKKYGQVTTCIAHSHLAKTQKSNSPITAIGTDILRMPLRYCATDYFACSASAALWLFKQSDIDNGRVKIVQNGIDSKQFDYNPFVREQIRTEYGLGNKVVIGHVGRFYHPKNHPFILDVFKEYHKMNPNSVLMLVGDGETRPDMEKKAAQLGISDDVLFMGVRSNVYEFEQAFDLFIMPSLYEGLPVAGIEAQAAGLPVVATDTITTEMDVTGNCKFLSLNDPIQVWAGTIEEMLDGYVRRSEADRIIEAGYDIQKTADLLQRFYIRRHKRTKK